MNERKYNITICLIVALKQDDSGIGCNNKLLWHLPRDLKFFKETTLGHYVIMGRRTFESISKPLSNRINIVVTSQKKYAEKKQLGKFDNVIVKHSLDSAIKYVEAKNVDTVFILGGAEIFRQAIKFADKIFVTEVNVTDKNIQPDTFFPEYKKNIKWITVSSKKYDADEKNKFDMTIKKLESISEHQRTKQIHLFDHH